MRPLFLSTIDWSALADLPQSLWLASAALAISSSILTAPSARAFSSALGSTGATGAAGAPARPAWAAAAAAGSAAGAAGTAAGAAGSPSAALAAAGSPCFPVPGQPTRASDTSSEHDTIELRRCTGRLQGGGEKLAAPYRSGPETQRISFSLDGRGA